MSSRDHEAEENLLQADERQYRRADGGFGSLGALLGWYFNVGERMTSPKALSLPTAQSYKGQTVVSPMVDGGRGSDIDAILALWASVDMEIQRFAAEQGHLWKALVLRYRGFLGCTPPANLNLSRRVDKQGALSFEQVGKALGVRKVTAIDQVGAAESELRVRCRRAGLLR